MQPVKYTACVSSSASCVRDENGKNGKRKYVQPWMLGLLVMILWLICATGSTEGQTTAEVDSVTVPTSILRRATTVIDSLDTEILLRDIRLAHADSVAAIREEYWRDEVRLQEESRERILDACRDKEEHWALRLVKEPLLWLAIGIYLGAQ
ncbi:MAG: hypothetical protein AMJ65_01670 [Phycisphaerae bacterium SG8_4]|nr:MAG: hypothetical protein AMJ65_01670 [Phycisphaerae bacterium SG8_4]